MFTKNIAHGTYHSNMFFVWRFFVSKIWRSFNLYRLLLCSLLKLSWLWKELSISSIACYLTEVPCLGCMGDHGMPPLFDLAPFAPVRPPPSLRDVLYQARSKLQSLLASNLPMNTSFFKQSGLRGVPRTSTVSFRQPLAALISPSPSPSLFHRSILPSTVLSASFSKTTSRLHPASSPISNPGYRPRIRRPTLTRWNISVVLAVVAHWRSYSWALSSSRGI